MSSPIERGPTCSPLLPSRATVSLRLHWSRRSVGRIGRTVEEFFADSRPPTDDDVPINEIGGVGCVAVDLAWRDELSRRSEQVATGTVATVGWDQVLERVADRRRKRLPH
jgi:hypothetical protein